MLKFFKGKKALVTSGPTHEPIDPVRYITSHSSGRQGHAIAEALSRFGAEVILISGPVVLSDPPGVFTIHVERAEEMLQATLEVLPVDIAVMVAAVADWKVSEAAREKIKKRSEQSSFVLRMAENPDILEIVGYHPNRPDVVVGFAAETQNVEGNGKEKLAYKGADFIVANRVSPISRYIDKEYNQVSIISVEGVEKWPELPKQEIARRLGILIAKHLNLISEIKPW